jgi:long-chain acyl-CoA synthetase
MSGRKSTSVSSGRARTLQTVIERFADYGESVALVEVCPNATNTSSFRTLSERARSIADELRGSEVRLGEPIGIVGPNSAGWVTTCFGILAAGAAVMPLDARQSEAERTNLITASGARFLYVASEASSRELVLRHFGDQAATQAPAGGVSGIVPTAAPEDLALLMHTSGTTGAPKAVPLSHANVVSNVDALTAALLVNPTDRTLLPLPLHHVYPLVVGLLLPLSAGGSVVLPAGLSGPELAFALKFGGANTLIGVPRLYDALQRTITGRVRVRGKVVASLFDRMLAFSSAGAREGRRALGRVAFSRVRRAVAPGLWRLASGGAALDETTELALLGLGYEVLVGYGLTETGPMVTFNRPGRARIGSAGIPLPGTELRIAHPGPDSIGEIEFRGPNVFRAYRDDATATHRAFTADGWFRTGDRGRLDADGYLYVLGRSSETLVLPGGEKLNPETVESGYLASSIVRDIAVLIEDGKLVALVAPSASADATEGAQRSESLVRAALAECSTGLPRYMQLAGFALAERPLPRTELGKLQRHLLPPLYRAARKRVELQAAEHPEPSPADRELLADPIALRIWTWLQNRYPERRLRLQMSPQLDLGIDSLEWVTLTMDLERALGITLDDAALERVRTLRDLVAEAISCRPRPPFRAAASDWLAKPSLLAQTVWYVGHAVNRALVRCFFPLRVEGIDNLPRRGPYVICANHSSYLDAPVLAAALPWPVLAQLFWGGSVDVMFSSAWRRLFSRLARVLPIDPLRGARAGLELSAETLRQGSILAWFPEGWRSKDGRLQPFLPGIGALVRHTPVPVVPAHIIGTFSAWPPQRRFPRPHRVRVRFGPVLDPKRWTVPGPSEEMDRRVAADVKAAFAALEGSAV